MLTNWIFSILLISTQARWLLETEESLEATATCKTYACKTTSVTIPTGSCGVDSGTTVSLVPCSTTTSISSYCNTTSLLCTNTPLTPALVNYPGEKCSTQSDCRFGICTSGICKGQALGETCTLHEQCDPGYRCSAGGVCVAQLGIGLSGCRSYADCVNWAGCNVTYTTSNGTCTQYASVGNGVTVTDCVNGWSELCSSGYCTKLGTWFGSLGVCSTAPMSVKAVPSNCSVNTDCLGTDGINMMLSSCKCGFNSAGQSYCMPFIGDPSGVSLIQTWVSALKSTSSCNTVRRSAEACLSLVGKLAATKSADFYFRNYSMTINNDICVKSIYTSDYWIISYAKIFGAGLSFFLLWV